MDVFLYGISKVIPYIIENYNKLIINDFIEIDDRNNSNLKD